MDRQRDSHARISTSARNAPRSRKNGLSRIAPRRAFSACVALLLGQPVTARAPAAHALTDTTLKATQRVTQPLELITQIAVLPELLLDLSDPRLDRLNDRTDARYLGHHLPFPLDRAPQPKASATPTQSRS